jgi:hypothetical protein
LLVEIKIKFPPQQKTSLQETQPQEIFSPAPHFTDLISVA